MIDLDKFIAAFPPGMDLDRPETKHIGSYKSVLPPEIINLWTKHGFGLYGDGLIQVVDPRQFQASLELWLGESDSTRVPLLMTAFGELFYFRQLAGGQQDISLIDIHYRRVEVCTYSVADFFTKFIVHPDIIDELLRPKLFAEARTLLGPLSSGQQYCFNPALVVGGSEAPAGIRIVDAQVHHEVLFQMGGEN